MSRRKNLVTMVRIHAHIPDAVDVTSIAVDEDRVTIQFREWAELLRVAEKWELRQQGHVSGCPTPGVEWRHGLVDGVLVLLSWVNPERRRLARKTVPEEVAS